MNFVTSQISLITLNRNRIMALYFSQFRLDKSLGFFASFPLWKITIKNGRTVKLLNDCKLSQFRLLPVLLRRLAVLIKGSVVHPGDDSCSWNGIVIYYFPRKVSLMIGASDERHRLRQYVISNFEERVGIQLARTDSPLNCAFTPG